MVDVPRSCVALFPDWFSVPTDDLHKQVQCFGFPLTDSATFVSPGVDEQLRHVLSAMADQRPVVFAPGSANFQAAKFLHTATEACRRLNLPAILLSPNRDDVPKDLPANVIAASTCLFPSCFRLQERWCIMVVLGRPASVSGRACHRLLCLWLLISSITQIELRSCDAVRGFP